MHSFRPTFLNYFRLADPLRLGNPCMQDPYSLSFLPLDFNVTLHNHELTAINGQTVLTQTLSSMDPSFSSCEQSGSLPLFPFQKESIQGSLGYLVSMEALKASAPLYIYNSLLKRILQYDQFDCPK